ncbi:MAG: type VI secretion lipoprotein TssJ [Deltaproteobacteria bacterium]|nr:type VI secretion lipoprotein TssJ [Deltaproteobacteria bacterium]
MKWLTDNNPKMTFTRKVGPEFAVVLIGLMILVSVTLLIGCGGGSKSQGGGKDQGGGGGSGSKDPVEIPPTAEPGAPKWEFASNAVTLRIRADNMLNTYENNPHTLVLCVYMFTDPNSFKDLAKSKDGVVKLLGCQKFSDTVASVQRVVMQPGEVRTIMLDRAEKAKYVGLAAGYFNLIPDKATRLLPFPVDVATEGWIFKDKYQLPGKLDVQIFLGSDEIREGGS